MKEIDELKLDIMKDPENAEFTKQGWEPIFEAPPTAKILIASQAPGIKAQESNKTFFDVSGNLLREWLGVDEEIFIILVCLELCPWTIISLEKASMAICLHEKNLQPNGIPKYLTPCPS